MSAGPGARRVLVSARLGAIGDPELRIAEHTGAEVLQASLWTKEELIANGTDADVLVLGASEPMTADVLARLPRLACVVRRGVGVDNVDVPAATREGIGVAYVPDASVEEVSDHALALMLALERGVVDIVTATRSSDPAGAAEAAGRSRRFSELTVGVVGLGRIGRALARKSASIFSRVVAADPYVDSADAAALGIELMPLEQLLASSDLISLHVPGSEGRALLGEAELAMVKPGARIVNTARGELLDEGALLDAIRENRIAGAALDVTQHEPLPADSPLRSDSRVLLTGHTAAKGRLSSAALRSAVADAAIAVLSGGIPEHLANPTVVGMPGSRLPFAPAMSPPAQPESGAHAEGVRP